MKKEFNSTFNEGLVSDLNELSTPSNVLTDCVNGTLITFDGNEFSLQNDMGNAQVIDSDGNDVTLPEGFYPLGIKEYGGVLYIVCAKKPVDAPLWVSGSYSLGAYVKDSSGLYYVSLVSNNTESLPIKSNSYWTVIGEIEDYNNYAGQVEFGSYPSPEFADTTSSITSSSVSIDQLLYKQVSVSDLIFKSGRYITFNDTSFDGSTLFSHYTYSNGVFTYVPVFYKIKLWHQLSNGFYDLTDDIWTKYCNFKLSEINNNFWLKDSTFKYYCPYQYKGKLAMSIEIEELDYFKLDGNTQVTYKYNSSGETIGYNFKFTLKGKGRGLLTVDSATITIKNNNETISYSTVSFVNNELEYSLDLNAEYKDIKLDYTITPNIYYSNSNITNDLPSAYLDSYTIKGSRLIVMGYGEIVFYKDPDSYVCDYINKWSLNTRFILKNTDGNYVDTTGAISDKPYVFLGDLSGTTYTQEYINNSVNTEEVIVATYNLDSTSNSPTILFSNQNLIVPSEFLNSFKQIYVSFSDTDRCTLIKLTINLSNPLPIVNDISSYVSIMQPLNDTGDFNISRTVSISSDLKTITSYIDPSSSYSISINNEFGEGYINSELFSHKLSPLKSYYSIYKNFGRPLETVDKKYINITNNFALILRLSVDAGINRYLSGNKTQLLSVQLGAYKNLPYADTTIDPVINSSPQFNIYYNDGVSNLSLLNKSLTWLNKSERNLTSGQPKTIWPEYVFRKYSNSDIHLIDDPTVGFCITASGTDLDASYDNIGSASNYVKLIIDNETFIVAKKYIMGTRTTETYDTNASCDVYTFTGTLGQDIIYGVDINPWLIRHRSSGLEIFTISGANSIVLVQNYTYTAAGYIGLVTWTASPNITINSVTDNTVTIVANSTGTGYIYAMDSHGTYITYTVTINE